LNLRLSGFILKYLVKSTFVNSCKTKHTKQCLFPSETNCNDLLLIKMNFSSSERQKLFLPLLLHYFKISKTLLIKESYINRE
ncbi:hypothetical protein HMPREF0535_1551, partial [Limosilactobacillus reuteri MM2-3]